MLDERTNILLKFINGYCQDKTYKIIQKKEMCSAFPTKFNMDDEGIGQIVDYLKTREYVAVKYSDAEQYCLSPLPKGRLYFEAQAEKISDKVYERVKTAKIVFFCSLVGSFLGSVLTLLANLLWLC